jgi:hypothetical protein
MLSWAGADNFGKQANKLEDKFNFCDRLGGRLGEEFNLCELLTETFIFLDFCLIT